MKKLLLLGVPLALGWCTRGTAQDPRVAAVNRSADFLAREGVNWIRARNCASCHHAPMTIWALHEARARGFAVDEAALREVTTWTLAGPANLIAAKVLPDPGQPVQPGNDLMSLAAPLLMAGGRTLSEPTTAVRDGLGALLNHIVTKQEADGSWKPVAEGRPPLFDGREVTTLWGRLGLVGPAQEEAAQRASEFLARTEPADSTQSAALRLLLAVRLGKEKRDFAPLIARVLIRQQPEGGWSQVPGMNSDAYATGQALVALTAAGLKPGDTAVTRAVDFLLRTQGADGSWPMTSRGRKPGDSGAKDVGPITYAATGWATLGLVAAVR